MASLKRDGSPARGTHAAPLACALAVLTACGASGPASDQASPLVPEVLSARCDSEAFHDLAANRRLSEVLVSWDDLRSMEVHDCQQLATEQTLGPLTAILVSTPRIASRQPPPRGHVVADVLNYDTTAYPSLRIEPGINCLWIQGDPETDPAGTNWIAAVRQPNTGDCMSADFSQPPVHRLQVRRMRYAPYGKPATYPSTGRWMWDHRNRSQFIGIRCGDAWCEIGSPGFASETALSDAHSVPGWHDEQPLSYMDGGTLRLSGLVGRLTAARGLDTLRITDIPVDDDRGIQVATMSFLGTDSAAFEAYVGKFKLDRTRPEHPIYMRVVQDPGASPPAAVWQMRSDGSEWTTVTRRDHTHSGPGTVRWGWDPVDEGVWVSCPEGCCYSNEFGDRAFP